MSPVPFQRLTAATLVALVLAGCKQHPPSDPPHPSVTVAPAIQRSVTDWNDFTGQFAAAQTVEVRPRVSGYILRVAFREGAEVREGDTLFLIDARPYAATLESAQAQLARAQSALKLATIKDKQRAAHDLMQETWCRVFAARRRLDSDRGVTPSGDDREEPVARLESNRAARPRGISAETAVAGCDVVAHRRERMRSG